MEPITINGQDYVRLHDVCDILRHVAASHLHESANKVIDQIAFCMFYDEAKKAKTKEERKSICELPGDFVIFKKLGHRNPNGKTLIWFTGFENKKEARATDCAEDAMIFKYRSMADHVAEMLGKDWNVICVGREHAKLTQPLEDWFDDVLHSEEAVDDN